MQRVLKLVPFDHCVTAWFMRPFPTWDVEPAGYSTEHGVFDSYNGFPDMYDVT